MQRVGHKTDYYIALRNFDTSRMVKREKKGKKKKTTTNGDDKFIVNSIMGGRFKHNGNESLTKINVSPKIHTLACFPQTNYLRGVGNRSLSPNNE